MPFLLVIWNKWETMEVGVGLYGMGEDISLNPIAYCLFILRQGLYVSSGVLFEKQGLDTNRDHLLH